MWKHMIKCTLAVAMGLFAGGGGMLINFERQVDSF